MRVDFTKAIGTVVAKDPRALFLTGDLGFNAFEALSSELGARFINTGVAEQNMIGMAAGMALVGYRPWVYSIAPFVTLRCLEQIRNDVCFHKLPVHLVGNGGGFTYGIMGSTHHALEDLGVLKTMPGMRLFIPCANEQVDAAVRTIYAEAAPSYLRLAISPFTTELKPLHENPRTLTRHYAKGSRFTVIGMGHATQIALRALVEAPGRTLDADIFALCRFPFDLEAEPTFLESVRRTRRVIVLEEHYLHGGLAESLRLHLPSLDRFEVMCVAPVDQPRYGSSLYHLTRNGLTPQDLLARLNS